MSIAKKIVEFVMDILETVTFVGSLFIVVYLFIMQPHQVKGSSMDNTFHNGEYILTNKISYRFSPPHRGDVVVFSSPSNKDIDFIKRVIGLPGDKIRIENDAVVVNDQPLDEGYISSSTQTFEDGFLSEGQEIAVPEGHIFVMGDNRQRSSDSRVFGTVPEQDIIGKVFFRYFPANKIGSVKNPYKSMLPIALRVSPEILSSC